MKETAQKIVHQEFVSLRGVSGSLILVLEALHPM